MPTRDQVETAVRTHFEAWNAADRNRWTRIWHPEVIMFDPVGGPEKRGSPRSKTLGIEPFSRDIVGASSRSSCPYATTRRLPMSSVTPI